jgi:hypothetical protein
MARARSAGSNGGGLAGAAALRGGTGTSGTNVVLKFRNRAINTYRGVAANAYGDLSDVGTLYLTGVPAAIAETTDVVFDAATQRQQIIRTVTCVLSAWVDVIDTDTLEDPFTGFYYMITSLEARPGIGYYPADKILSLRLRSGVSISSD